MGMINGLGAPLSGMQANQLRVDVSANNVANVNTDGFKASTVQTTDSAYINDIGQGTQVSATYAPSRPGPVTPAASGSGMVEQSNTELATEATSQMAAQSAYGFNVSMLKTANDMVKNVLDIMG